MFIDRNEKRVAHSVRSAMSIDPKGTSVQMRQPHMALLTECTALSFRGYKHSTPHGVKPFASLLSRRNPF
jgi:hypothetical protein